jgi:hypothetical protein
MYIIRNLITGELYSFDKLDSATEQATKCNKVDSEHPSFSLFKTGKNRKCIYLGRLYREFGKEELFFKVEFVQ